MSTATARLVRRATAASQAVPLWSCGWSSPIWVTSERVAARLTACHSLGPQDRGMSTETNEEVPALLRRLRDRATWSEEERASWLEDKNRLVEHLNQG